MSSERVTPGDILGVSEEFLPGSGVYEDERGYLRSCVLGLALIDRYKKTAAVKPAVNKYLTLKSGDVVEGIVEYMNEDLAFVRIYWVENRRAVKPVNAVGVLHISQASQTYVESMYDIVRLSDVVRAKVVGGKGVYQLSIKEPHLGVVYARCNYCGGELLYENGRLVCSLCGQVNKRKVASTYILTKVQ